MDKKQIDFILEYAEIGVVASMKSSNPIKREELKQEYLKIKKELLESKEEERPDIKNGNSTQHGGKKESAVKKWFNGIGKRQKEYQEAHEGELM